MFLYKPCWQPLLPHWSCLGYTASRLFVPQKNLKLWWCPLRLPLPLYLWCKWSWGWLLVHSIPYIFESNWLGIGFAAFVAVIASLNLILDFDLIESSAAQYAPKAMEWLCGIALLATLVWMYYSFLRLLGFITRGWLILLTMTAS